MAAKKVKVVLNTDEASSDCGKFSAEAEGYFGKGCAADLAVFEKLGGVTKSTKKPEYRQVKQGQVSVNA